MINPVPALLVSCGATPAEYNVFTAAWTGTVCSDPAMCYVSVRPERFSHAIILRNMAFTLNLTTRALARATDWCGVRSGRDYDKWREAGLTPHAGVTIAAPYVEESPMSIECRVTQVMRLGTHDMFLAQVTNVIADDRFLDRDTGAFDFKKADLLAYCHGEYFALGEPLGRFGWTVKKSRKR